jgi:hypothetical protein
MRKPTSNIYPTFQNIWLSGNQKKKAGVSLKVVKETIAVRLWFDSQTSLKLIPWPESVQNIFPMKKIWNALLD